MRWIEHQITVLPVLLCVALLLLSGCSPARTGLIGGETVTPERLREISASLFTTAVEPESDSEPVATLDGVTGPVYWAAGGSVLHLDADCYHLARASQILTGTVEEAIAAGKQTLCASCQKRHAESTAATADPATAPVEVAP